MAMIKTFIKDFEELPPFRKRNDDCPAEIIVGAYEKEY
jgi:hypothetical protein